MNWRKRGIGLFADLRGGLAKKEKRRGYVFEVCVCVCVWVGGAGGGVKTTRYAMSWRSLLTDTNFPSK